MKGGKGNQMPQKRDRKKSSIFVIAGEAAVQEFEDIKAADRVIKASVDVIVIRGNKLEKRVTTTYI